MARTYRFTRTSEEGPISVVLDKIMTVDLDLFAGGSQITLVNGESISVMEGFDEVIGIIEGAR